MITKEEYNSNYFDGNHPAGYSMYSRNYYVNSDDRDSQNSAEYTAHKKLYSQFSDKFSEQNNCLDIGCAKGFLVEDFRMFGVDCYGLDWSEYAASKSNVSEFIKVEDAYSHLKQIPDKAYDVVTLIRFMPCLPDDQIEEFLVQVRRISKFQIFVVDDKEFYSNADFNKLLSYYNIKGFNDWLSILKTETSHVESILDERWDGIR